GDFVRGGLLADLPQRQDRLAPADGVGVGEVVQQRRHRALCLELPQERGGDGGLGPALVHQGDQRRDGGGRGAGRAQRLHQADLVPGQLREEREDGGLPVGALGGERLRGARLDVAVRVEQPGGDGGDALEPEGGQALEGGAADARVVVVGRPGEEVEGALRLQPPECAHAASVEAKLFGGGVIHQLARGARVDDRPAVLGGSRVRGGGDAVEQLVAVAFRRRLVMAPVGGERGDPLGAQGVHRLRLLLADLEDGGGEGGILERGGGGDRGPADGGGGAGQEREDLGGGGLGGGAQGLQGGEGAHRLLLLGELVEDGVQRTASAAAHLVAGGERVVGV